MGGYEKHQERAAALNELGRALARRAKSRCELCQEGGVALKAYEVPPAPSEPELDHTLLLCEPCLAGLERPAGLSGQRWRFLETSVWSDFTPVKVCTIRLLRGLNAQGQAWAGACLESAYLTEDEQAWVDAHE